MIKGLYEAHLPVRNLEKSLAFYKGLGLEFSHSVEGRLAFLWIEEGKSWLGLWECGQARLDYHPSIRHVAFEVTLEDLKKAVSWLVERGHEPREAFGFEPVEPFVMANPVCTHAKIHFNDPDGNSLELITSIPNPRKREGMMYLSDWEQANRDVQ
ncbi:glutathione transferase [Alteribacter lacisalsi]|uniref:Glutathione transferase n=1 Tax=Alteribacter lacisalsi TaxID=2045244 RepID=A0A2W0HHL5_9BACI|nr:VOC family protein [Alteribacter lacisalsi]PYZ96442.1 glutathione transferase [Alteribacter lacisalsi]